MTAGSGIVRRATVCEVRTVRLRPLNVVDWCVKRCAEPRLWVGQRLHMWVARRCIIWLWLVVVRKVLRTRGRDIVCKGGKLRFVRCARKAGF